MSYDQFHRENVSQLWKEWTPPRGLPKCEGGASFIAFIRERYESAQNKLEHQPSFEQRQLFDEVG